MCEIQFRLPKDDKRKTSAKINKQLIEGISCIICSKPISKMTGPGSDKLCRLCQIQQREYGGYGRIDRPHTFHRSDVCSCCGQDINEDPRWEKAQTFFGITLTEEQTHEIKRRYNHGDHEFRKADGGNDSAENTNAFCSFCHWVKTVINNDGRLPSFGQIDA